MGYNITIGNAYLQYTRGDEHMSIMVEAATNENAPDHDPFTGKGNSRSPSYTAWHDFCREAGIHELFYGQGWSREERRYLECSEGFHRETPLLAEHPGAFPLFHEDLQYITAARIRRQQTNGGRPPGFWDWDDERGEIDNGNDHVLARLVWLEFWIEWALGNCERPAIANS
jgi:hypothetical protein